MGTGFEGEGADGRPVAGQADEARRRAGLGMFDTDITIYNRWYDETLGVERYLRTVVRGVSWHGRLGTAAEPGGAAPARVFRIRIPDSARCDKVFVPALWLEDERTQYTLRGGDRLVRGVSAVEIAPGEGLGALERLFPEVCTVTEWRDNRRALLAHLGLLPHLYVEGV